MMCHALRPITQRYEELIQATRNLPSHSMVQRFKDTSAARRAEVNLNESSPAAIADLKALHFSNDCPRRLGGPLSIPRMVRWVAAWTSNSYAYGRESLRRLRPVLDQLQPLVEPQFRHL
jgi:hypothetical protein